MIKTNGILSAGDERGGSIKRVSLRTRTKLMTKKVTYETDEVSPQRWVRRFGKDILKVRTKNIGRMTRKNRFELKFSSKSLGLPLLRHFIINSPPVSPAPTPILE